jgi:glycosyltransferase involved in cell wall biosynthesis
VRILHLDSEKTWRGGENQVRYLIEGLNQKNIEQWAAAPKSSVAIQEKRWNCSLIPLASGNPLDIRNWRILYRAIQSHKIDIVDAHSAKAHSLALNMARFFPRLKIVIHRRVDNIPRANYFTQKKYLHPRINQFVAISEAISDVLKKYGVENSKITTVKSAVSFKSPDASIQMQDKTEIRKKFGFTENGILIGNASALSPQKGYETLIRSVAELKKNGISGFKVVIAGSGELEQTLKNLTEELGLINEIQFLGFIKNVPEFLACLDILAIPSNNEGLGTVILDAILAGCCPVGSRVGGIPEIIIHGETGLLIEPGDAKGLAEQLKRLIQEPKTRALLSQKALHHVKTNFTLSSMVEGNLKVYEKIMGFDSRQSG